MKDTDLDSFLDVWTAASEVYNVTLTDAAVMLAFQVLERYEIKDIRYAISLYLGDPESGRFPPKPADIVGQIESTLIQDGRPEADEAWSIAVDSFDESKTVVLNNEIACALEMSAPIYRDGDKVGARMAFRPAYERFVREARSNREPAKWFASLGHDVEGREKALSQAVNKKLLTSDHIENLLPTKVTEDGLAIAGLLTGNVVRIDKDNKKILSKLERLKQEIRKVQPVKNGATL